MKVVVTGGAGFIGANLCRELAAHRAVDRVAVIDDLSTGDQRNLDGVDVEFHRGSILDHELLNDVVSDASAVVHLAARPSVPRSLADPVASHEVNATGTLNVLESARASDQGPIVIVASSSSVYGSNPVLPKHEDLRPVPMSPYAVSKLAAESYAVSHQQVYGMATLSFRFFNVFGPLQTAGHAYAAVVPAFVDAALRGMPLPLLGDGTQSRDFTYVGTVTRILCQAAVGRISSPGPVNLAFGTRTTLLELISELEQIMGTRLAVEQGPSRPGDVQHSQANNGRLLELFPGVEPVGLRRGLEATVDWLATTI